MSKGVKDKTFLVSAALDDVMEPLCGWTGFKLLRSSMRQEAAMLILEMTT